MTVDDAIKYVGVDGIQVTVHPEPSGPPPPRVKVGEYNAVCYAVETGISFGAKKKLFLKFRLSGGQFDGTERIWRPDFLAVRSEGRPIIVAVRGWN